MRKEFFFSNLIILVLITLSAFSQNEGVSKFEVSVNGGLSLPVGAYGNNNSSKSAIYIIGAPETTVKGFSKVKSGFAVPGSSYNLTLKFKMTNNLKLLFQASNNNNGVETDGMSVFLTELYNSKETKVEEVNYRVLFFSPGIGYYSSIKKFELGINLFVGYSIANYPYYKIIYLYTNLSTPPILAHVGAKPNLSSLTFGTSLCASYKFTKKLSIGVNILYQTATFSYNLHPENYPGGGGSNFDFSDKLKVRILNTLVCFGYSF
ncbi:MAG: hypothetical protein WCS03_17230 [Bacteroidota bacterium]